MRKAALRVVREMDKLRGRESSESKVSNDTDEHNDAESSATSTPPATTGDQADTHQGTEHRTSSDLPRVIVNEDNLKDFVGLPSFTSDRFYSRPPAGKQKKTDRKKKLINFVFIIFISNLLLL